MNITMDRSKHPCFNKEVSGQCGRVHLPVAPKCNIMCNYCNRKYDCVNESRPGVTSAVLSPLQSVAYMDEVLAREPRITVAGIAGPGDPMANPEQTLTTMRLLREKYPQLLFCLSSNGLALPAHLDELVDVGVTHVTVTVNAVDPEMGSRFYRWVRDGKVVYRGRDAAELMLERQTEAIKGLKERGLIVKVNTIVTPGYNTEHIEDIAKQMASWNVDILNLMPLHPTPGTEFESVLEPKREVMQALRDKAEEYIPQMRHCKRCRADAVGLLGEDRSREMSGCLSACSKLVPGMESKPHVAVGTMEGMLVNKHLGEAEKLQIWTKEEKGYVLVEERFTPEPGGGGNRWAALAELIKDCRAVLVSGVGPTPRQYLEECGMIVLEMSGLIQDGLEAVYGSGDISAFKKRKVRSCTTGCSGGGEGC